MPRGTDGAGGVGAENRPNRCRPDEFIAGRISRRLRVFTLGRFYTGFAERLLSGEQLTLVDRVELNGDAKGYHAGYRLSYFVGLGAISQTVFDWRTGRSMLPLSARLRIGAPTAWPVARPQHMEFQTKRVLSGPVAVSDSNLLGRSLVELEQLMAERDLPAYRGRQLFHWIYNRRARGFDAMSDLPQSMRRTLAEEFSIKRPIVTDNSKSSDGTRKLLFESDEVVFETALIPDRRTTTACVSSQAGCPLACRFCATGTLNLTRNLTAGEIVAQLLTLRDMFGDEAFSNIVFMGMGEPLLNYDEVMKAVEIIVAEDGLNLGARRITVSTSGITPKIKRLGSEARRINLAISLHAATQEKREVIMPVAKTFGIDKLIAAAKEFSVTQKRRVTFEYIVFADFNDSAKDAEQLAKLVGGMDCKINLLAYNPIPGVEFERPSEKKLNWFARELVKRDLVVTVRTSRGLDIDAACGQLAGRCHQTTGRPRPTQVA